MVGMLLNDALQAHISVGRLQKYLFSDDIDTSYIQASKYANKDNAIKIANGTFFWLEAKKDNPLTGSPIPKAIAETKPTETVQAKPKLVLKDINIEIKTGSFVAILGE